MDSLHITYTLEQIEHVAKQVLQSLETKVVLFYGEVGSGKTTLIQALLTALGSDDKASSPTFSLVNEYELPNDTLYHFDLYRLNTLEEALDFGIEDYFHSNHWIYIEWPQQIEAILPNDVALIEILTISPEKRTLKLTRNTENLTKTKTYVTQ